MKMNQFFSPKLVITDYYDSLIREIDIYTEKSIDKHSDDDLLPEEPDSIEEQPKSTIEDDIYPIDDPYSLKYSYGLIVAANRTRIIDYLNQVRTKAIEELKSAQEENLISYEANKSKIHIDRENMDTEKIEALKRQLFNDRFSFLVISNDNEIKEKIFSYQLHVVITDFYLTPFEIEFIK